MDQKRIENQQKEIKKSANKTLRQRVMDAEKIRVGRIKKEKLINK